MIEMARSLLKGKGLPVYFRGEAIRHSIYLLNRLPTRAVEGVTPYEAWSGSKPQLDHLRIFGCLDHMRIPSVNLKKLYSRSKEVVYLGKEPGSKAHRVYDPNSKTICISRDLVFEENKGWDWSNESFAQGSYPSNFVVFDFNTAPESDSVNDSTGDSLQNTPTSNNSGVNSGMYSGRTETNSHNWRYRSVNDIYAETEPV